MLYECSINRRALTFVKIPFFICKYLV